MVCHKSGKLLFISPVHPSSGGSGLAMRAWAVLLALQKHYQVYLLVVDPWLPERRITASVPEGIEIVEAPSGMFQRSPSAGQPASRRRITPLEWPTLTASQGAFLVNLGERLGFDKLHVFRLYMAPYAAPFLGRVSCQLDLDEVESRTRWRHAQLCTQTGKTADARAHAIAAQFYAATERAWLGKFDKIFVCSRIDAEQLKWTTQGVSISVLPNVVEIPKIPPPMPSGDHFTLLFVGNMGYYPNRDAVRFLTDEIVPALRRLLEQPFKVKIVGSGELPEDQIVTLPPEVYWMGYATDLAPAYAECHAVVAPIRSAGGTRIKILEAFAHFRPVVATSIAAEGLSARPDTHFLVGDTAIAFARACAHLQADVELRHRLAKKAFSLVCNEFAPDRLEALL